MQYQKMFARIFDITLCLILLVFAFPFMLLAAILIKFESAGPVLYRQLRVGLNGKIFTVCKFRSMRIDAEIEGPIWAKKNDTRVSELPMT